MSDTLTADLATGADESPFSSVSSPSTSASETPSSEPPQSLSDMLDKAIDSEPSPVGVQPTGEPDNDNVDRGDGRNARGRWVGKGPDPKLVGAAPGAPGATPTKPGEQTPTETPKGSFRYRAMGQTHDSGATQGEDGSVTFPPDKVPFVREALNAFHQRQASFVPTVNRLQQDNQRLTRELEQANSGSSATDAQAQKIVEFFAQACQEPDDEKALGMMFEMRRNFPLLIEKARSAHFEQQLKAGKAPAQVAAPEQRPAQSTMPSHDDATSTTREWVERFKVEHEFRNLTDTDWQQFDADCQASPYAFLRVATPEEVQQRHVAPGQIVFDTDRLSAAITKYAKTQSDARAAAAKTAELAAKNAVRTQSTVSAPPSAGGTQPPPKSEGKISSKAEWEKWKNSDEI